MIVVMTCPSSKSVSFQPGGLGVESCAPGSAASEPVGPGPGSIGRQGSGQMDWNRWPPSGGPRLGSGKGLGSGRLGMEGGWGLHPPDIPGLSEPRSSYWEKVG